MTYKDYYEGVEGMLPTLKELLDIPDEVSGERYGNEHILPKSFIDKMDEDIKELSGSECISYNKPFVFPAGFSDVHRCRFCNDHMRPVSYVRRKEDK